MDIYNQKKTGGKIKITIKELMEVLKNLNPETEVHYFDNELGWSEVKVSVNKTDGVVFEAK